MRNSLDYPDLRSAEVTKRLMAEERLLIEDITSRLYSKMLAVVSPELPTIKNWSQIDKKLTWVLRTEVELFGDVAACRQLMETLIAARGAETIKPLEDLIYQYYFLSQDLLSLFYELDYSTWNLLDFLDPNHYFGLCTIPAEILEEIEALRVTGSAPSASLNRFGNSLVECGLDRTNVQATIEALFDWSQRSNKYEELMIFFYEAEDPVKDYYGFHYSISAAVDLLSRSLAMKLMLKPLNNQLRELFTK